MTTDTFDLSALYSPFLQAGLKQEYVTVPPPASDPTLSLKIHTLVKQPTATEDSTKTIVFLHGHPQSNVIWHRVIPFLQSTLTPSSWNSLRIIIPDLRGHGLSGVPDIERDDNGAYKNQAMRERYSKRQMGRDIVEVVNALGCTQQFFLVAHDRGARISHRLALDCPDRIAKMVLLDIAPTMDMYQQTDYRFATLYWHWFFLTQPWPFSEEMITSNPKAYLTKLTSRFATTASSSPANEATHPPHILASYLSTLSNPLNAQATCEDYRASNPIDGVDITVHDVQSRRDGIRIKCPTKVLWGAKGVIERLYGKQKTLDFWRDCCQHPQLIDDHSKALDCGHYLPEEDPQSVVRELIEFLPV